MSLVEQINSIKTQMGAYDFDGGGWDGCLIGFSEAREAAAEIAKQYDVALAEIAGLAGVIISMQAGSFSSDEGSSYELNIAADMAEEMLGKIKEIL